MTKSKKKLKPEICKDATKLQQNTVQQLCIYYMKLSENELMPKCKMWSLFEHL